MRWLAAGLVGATCLVASVPARAHGHPDDVLVAIMVGTIVADTAFFAIDAIAAIDDSRSNAWVIPQAILTTPQVLFFSGFELSDPFESAPGLLFSGVVHHLGAFSIYGLASPRVSTTALYGLSWGIGTNTALTSNVIGYTIAAQFAPPAIAPL